MRAFIDDGRRPHRYPSGAPAEVLSWACAECGEVVREFGPVVDTECPVNWRERRWLERRDAPRIRTEPLYPLPRWLAWIQRRLP